MSFVGLRWSTKVRIIPFFTSHSTYHMFSDRVHRQEALSFAVTKQAHVPHTNLFTKITNQSLKVHQVFNIGYKEAVHLCHMDHVVLQAVGCGGAEETVGFRKSRSSLDLGIDLRQDFIFSRFFSEGHVHSLLFLALLLLLFKLVLIGALFGTRDVLGLCFLVLFRLNVIVVLVLRSKRFPNSSSWIRS